MRSIIERALLKMLSCRMARQANSVELNPKYVLQKSIKLESSEIDEIKKVWKPISNHINYRYWMLYKGIFPFTPLLMPDDIFVRHILRVLNPMRKAYCLQNKNMYPIIYSGLLMPVTLINHMDGQGYDAENNTVKPHDILNVLMRKAKSTKVILKPSADSCSGNGVRILDLHDEKLCLNQIRDAGPNYVVQEILSQSEKTKRFNPSSLNTFRINTLNLNGVITVENIMFRHGQGDSVVDNAGAGGICVGFDPNGNVIGKAIDANLNVHETTLFGVKYCDLKIPELQDVSETAVAAHRLYLPFMGHAAWDFALNEKDEPVFIEVNLGWPGIMTEQLSSCRPIFGNRTQEVIEFAIKNKSLMTFTDFLGHWT